MINFASENSIRMRFLLYMRFPAFLILLFLGSLHMFPAGKSVGDGKVVAVLGDSMTWIGGEDFSGPCGWTSHFFRLLGDSVVGGTLHSYARSGATWTNTRQTKADTEAYSEVLDDDNVIFNQMLRLEKDSVTPDVVIMFAGTNDAWFSDSRPGLFDSVPPIRDIEGVSPADVTTLKGSVNLVCERVSRDFPESEVVIVTPPYSRKIADSLIEKVGECLNEVAQERGVKCIRGDLLFGFEIERENSAEPLTTDGVHPNEAGALKIAEIIFNSLRGSLSKDN